MDLADLGTALDAGAVSDCDSLYDLDELAPPQGPQKPFGTILAGPDAAALDAALDLANEEPDGDDGDSSADFSISSSSYAESESTLDLDAAINPPGGHPPGTVKLRPPPDLSAVSLAKSEAAERSSPPTPDLAQPAARARVHAKPTPPPAITLDPASPGKETPPAEGDPAEGDSEEEEPIPDPHPANIQMSQIIQAAQAERDGDIAACAPALDAVQPLPRPRAHVVPAYCADIDLCAPAENEVDLAAAVAAPAVRPVASEEFAETISNAASYPLVDVHFPDASPTPQAPQCAVTSDPNVLIFQQGTTGGQGIAESRQAPSSARTRNALPNAAPTGLPPKVAAAMERAAAQVEQAASTPPAAVPTAQSAPAPALAEKPKTASRASAHLSMNSEDSFGADVQHVSEETSVPEGELPVHIVAQQKEVADAKQAKEKEAAAESRETDADSKSENSETSARSESGTSAPKKSSGGGNIFFRASSTFYKAFVGGGGSKPDAKEQSKKEKRKSEPARPVAAVEAPPPPPPKPLTPEQIAQREQDEDLAHVKLEHHLGAQIATLRSAQSGFVDLTLLAPMTASTLAAVTGEARRLLCVAAGTQARAEHVKASTAGLAAGAETELATKEQLLVSAKLRLAEARCEVQMLKHDLHEAQKGINQPERVAARERYAVRMRRERAEKELNAAMESSDTMQKNLIDRQASLRRDKASVKRLEKSVKDLEGDWA